MTKKLLELAEVFTGHTLRSGIQNDPNGECAAIQLKNVFVNREVKFKDNPHYISITDIPENQLLKRGDILLISKGANNKALLYLEQYAPAVAVSAFTVIRLKSNKIQPDFLAWFINSAQSQEYFNMHRAGTTTLNLSKKAIEELSVPLLPLDKQQIMMKLVNQYELYKSLVAEYEYNTRLLVEHKLYKHLNEQY